MSLELVNEKIYLDQNVGSEATQILVEGDIIVPDIKPDMSVMLQTDAKIRIDKAEASTDRVNFVGKLELSVLYIAKAAERPVHSISHTTPVDDFLNIDGATKDMWVEAKAEIVNVDYKMLNDRKISYRAVVDITISAEKSEMHEVVVNISNIPANQLLKTSLNVNKSVEARHDRIVVKDACTIPAGKPNISEILLCSTHISNKECRVSHGKVTITGGLLLTTLYRGDAAGSLIEFIENEIPINSVLEVADARDDMVADVSFDVSDVYAQVRPDADGEDRVIEAEFTMPVSLRVYSSENVEILEDAYCINQKLDIGKAPIKYPRLVCRNRNQTPIKEILQIGDGCPDILQVFRVKGYAHLDDVKIIEDKVVAEGVISADVLYVAQSDDTPLYSFKSVIPFRQVIETKGSAPHMRCGIDVAIDHIAFNMLSGRETEVRFLLTFGTQVVEEKEMEAILSIEASEMEQEELDKMASMTIYVVQSGDTLWKIAKRYNTEINDLLAVNELENANKIMPGQKLLILKKVV